MGSILSRKEPSDKPGTIQNCSGTFFDFPNGYPGHPHGCNGVGASCELVCSDGLAFVSASCEEQVVGGVAYPGASVCRCTPFVCCEENGCQAGHGPGSGWDGTNCNPENPNQPHDACGCCEADGSSPIIVSLRGNAVTLSDAAHGVLFDFWGNGQPQRLAWPTRPDDAWLVWDRNRNGLVDNGGELFGNAARLSSGANAQHGFEVLEELDENGDQRVDASDSMFGQFFLWRDVRRNGRVDHRELELVRNAGIIAISTEFRESRRTDEWGNEFRYRGHILFSYAPFRRPLFDVFLVTEEPGS